MDLGECTKIHDIALVADFNNASKTQDYFYDVDVCEADLVFLNGFYRTMLCIRGTSHGPVSVSVSVSVCHKSEFY